MRSTLPALVIATILVACNSFQSPTPTFDHDPADTEQVDAPPSENELANSGIIDVTIPAPITGEGSDSERHMGVAATVSSQPVVVYVNGKGGTYYAGNDNASAHTSSILSYYGRQSAVLPAAGYQGAQWQQLLDCMRTIYTPYNVTITDQKPAAGTYTEIVVSNTWASSAMGISNAIGGIAPLGQCRTVPAAIGYVFEAIYDQPGYGGVRGACESASHELGHTLSLSHEQLSTDLMSYAPANANKKFQDQASACGVSTQAPEACTCGAATQSSNRQLLSIVGAASAGGGTTNPGDTTAPKISIVSPANDSSQPGNANVVIAVDATDETSLSDVRLVWQYTNATLACDASISGVTCDHTGNRYTWTVFAGTGDRSFYAYAVDGGGNKASTTLETIHLTGGAATTDAPPTVSLQYPANNTAIARGGDVIFQAAVSDDIGISDVRATWYYDGGSLQYPMALTSTAGVYQARTTVSASATPGWRTVEIEATDTKAQRTLSQRVNVYVQ